MSMTTELVKKLREIAKKYYDNNGSKEYEVFKYLHEAANTIEELSAKLHASQMERSSQYYHGGWISCNDLVPEDLEIVNVQCVYETYFEHKIIVAAGRYCKGEWDLYLPNENNGADIDYTIKVIGWQPLPKPYKAESEE